MNFTTVSIELVYCLILICVQRIPSLNGYNPGPCNSTNHGKEVLTKDRHDEEIILICVKDKNGFKWKSTDGMLVAMSYYCGIYNAHDLKSTNLT
jgi:hypothetical protein